VVFGQSKKPIPINSSSAYSAEEILEEQSVAPLKDYSGNNVYVLVPSLKSLNDRIRSQMRNAYSEASSSSPLRALASTLKKSTTKSKKQQLSGKRRNESTSSKSNVQRRSMAESKLESFLSLDSSSDEYERYTTKTVQRQREHHPENVFNGSTSLGHNPFAQVSRLKKGSPATSIIEKEKLDKLSEQFLVFEDSPPEETMEHSLTQPKHVDTRNLESPQLKPAPMHLTPATLFADTVRLSETVQAASTANGASKLADRSVLAKSGIGKDFVAGTQSTQSAKDRSKCS
jgi:hypothetical protein